jgi:hypothetical protein
MFVNNVPILIIIIMMIRTIVSSDGATILRSLKICDPAASLLVQVHFYLIILKDFSLSVFWSESIVLLSIWFSGSFGSRIFFW